MTPTYATYTVNGNFVEVRQGRHEATLVVSVEYADRAGSAFSVDLRKLSAGDPDERAQIRSIAQAAYGYLPTASEVSDFRRELERFDVTAYGSNGRPLRRAAATYPAFSRTGRPVRVTIPEKE